MLARSFGDPEPEPEPQFQPSSPPAGTVEIAVRFVADRQSLAVLGEELAAVISAAVQDGFTDGLAEAKRS